MAASESVSTGIGAIFILFAVGGLIGTWALCGTLVAMVYYGLQLLSPNYFFVSACLITAIRGAFEITPLLFIPLLVVIGLALLKVPAFTAIFLGSVAGGVLAVIVAPGRVIAFADAPDLPAWLALLKGVWRALASGYTSRTGFAPMDMLATRGGMDSMLNTIWLIVSALAFGGVVEKSGVLDRLITPIIEKAKSHGTLIASLVSSIFATNIITADQYIAIVLPGRMFKPAFDRRGLAPVVLSRTVGDTATPTSALIPWNSCGAYMAATLGVATWSYAPFAVFSYVSPLLAVAGGYLGIRVLRAATAGPADKTGSGAS